MATERVAAILRSRGSFSAEQVDAMSDVDAWRWVYEQDHAKAKIREIEICFTGFQDSEKALLEAQAIARGLRVRTKVTQNLTYLCTGPNAGPSKVNQASALGVSFLSPKQFHAMCETGEVPLG
jgi:NAD-dependent DNA ligase